MASLFDSHTHLNLIQHKPLQQILSEAYSQGITHMITVATSEKNWAICQKLSRYDSVFYTLGIHPHETQKTLPYYFDTLSSYLTPKCVAIGEIGLDYYYQYSPPKTQLEYLEYQIDIANQYKLPIVLHCREAFNDLFNLLKKKIPSQGGIFHCFTGNWNQATQALNLGFYISFSGILTFKNASPLREVAKKLPLEKILIETDAPYLAPTPYRGKPNEPAYLIEIARLLAALHKKSLEEIANITFYNTQTAFKIQP